MKSISMTTAGSKGLFLLNFSRSDRFRIIVVMDAMCKIWKLYCALELNSSHFEQPETKELLSNIEKVKSKSLYIVNC